MQQQEATAGIEHQLTACISLSVRYVHKQIDRAIEDTRRRSTPDGNEDLHDRQPRRGAGRAGVHRPGRRTAEAEARLRQRRVRAREALRGTTGTCAASYLWSRLYGNYTGLSQSDENGRTARTSAASTTTRLMMFQDGGDAVYGPLPTDRPHQFKTQFIYQFVFGTSIGVNHTRERSARQPRDRHLPNEQLPGPGTRRGSDGRTPTFSQTNLLLLHNFRFEASRAFQLSLNVLNLFDQDTAVARSRPTTDQRPVVPNEALFYTGQADARVAHHLAEHHPGSGFPDEQRVPGAD